MYFYTQIGKEKNKDTYFGTATNVGKFYHVVVCQNKNSDGKYIFEIFVNGERVKYWPNTNPLSFDKVNVWISDPWYAGVESIGSIERLVISDASPPSGDLFNFIYYRVRG